MRDETRKSQFRRNMVLVLAFLAAGGALVLFRTQVLGIFTPARPTYDDRLLGAVTVSGLYRAEDLRFTPSEIRKLNIAALSNRDIFSGMDLKVDPASKRTSRSAVDRATPLHLSLSFKARDAASEVCCWRRTVKRRDLVPHVVRYMKRARELYTHYRKEIGPGRSIQRLYL